MLTYAHVCSRMLTYDASPKGGAPRGLHSDVSGPQRARPLVVRGCQAVAAGVAVGWRGASAEPECFSASGCSADGALRCAITSAYVSIRQHTPPDALRMVLSGALLRRY
jgi:hypothetical protein